MITVTPSPNVNADLVFCPSTTSTDDARPIALLRPEPSHQYLTYNSHDTPQTTPIQPSTQTVRPSRLRYPIRTPSRLPLIPIEPAAHSPDTARDFVHCRFSDASRRSAALCPRRLASENPTQRRSSRVRHFSALRAATRQVHVCNGQQGCDRGNDTEKNIKTGRADPLHCVPGCDRPAKRPGIVAE